MQPQGDPELSLPRRGRFPDRFLDPLQAPLHGMTIHTQGRCGGDRVAVQVEVDAERPSQLLAVTMSADWGEVAVDERFADRLVTERSANRATFEWRSRPGPSSSATGIVASASTWLSRHPTTPSRGSPDPTTSESVEAEADR